ncbi:hypothetical protein ES332_D13G076600v1 [Gossypium tomentosum]|uniref:Uncharacterized protein n=1 Tax=Gossypium tomentosum TaxID=34277 RepID=A0A5D2HTV9_GOSTO|nr:hypothetical protein ES332_D13G076600v1 [Gossypium tomentosum]
MSTGSGIKQLSQSRIFRSRTGILKLAYKSSLPRSIKQKTRTK